MLLESTYIDSPVGVRVNNTGVVSSNPSICSPVNQSPEVVTGAPIAYGIGDVLGVGG